MFEPIGNDGHFLDKAYPVLVSQLSDFSTEQGFWGYGKWYERLFDIENGKEIEVLYENDQYDVYSLYFSRKRNVRDPSLASLRPEIPETSRVSSP